MKILLFLERSDVRGGIEIFAERHADKLRAAGHEVSISDRFDKDDWDEIVVHKCSDVARLEKFPPEKTTCSRPTEK